MKPSCTTVTKGHEQNIRDFASLIPAGFIVCKIEDLKYRTNIKLKNRFLT